MLWVQAKEKVSKWGFRQENLGMQINPVSQRGGQKHNKSQSINGKIDKIIRLENTK